MALATGLGMDACPPLLLKGLLVGEILHLSKQASQLLILQHGVLFTCNKSCRLP